MFEQISESFRLALSKVRFVDDEKALKNAMDVLKKALLKADVHHKVTKDLLVSIENDMKQGTIGQKQFLDAIKSNLTTVLTAPGNQGFVYASVAPTTVLMAGLQGSGKTTTTVKLASYLKLRKKRVLIAACDLQRLAAVEQLRQLCEANEIDLFYIENETDPKKVAKEALSKAKSGLYDVLLVDTAGRLAIDEKLMQEIQDIKNIVNPHEIFYVADAMSGQDGVKSASKFNEVLNISGVILSKFDSDSKGGVAISVAKQLQIPLRFVGVGEKVSDLESFIPDRIVSRIMGEGDLATLVEKTSTIIDEKEAKRLSQKIKKGQFNFNDFLDQMESVKKLGSMKSLLGMIPGMSNMANQIKDIDLENSKEILHIRAMINSMTKKERENPDLLNNSRKRRLAAGSGLSQVEVNRFLKQFENASKLAKKFSGKGGAKGLANMLAQANLKRPV
ncbi:signal recognition particle protein [Campylobacter pinnipediorum]|uniref:signal-recognition-particle GTPase n=1 Tax=Campylobacter pinnipediorum subsp. pinnipediorum TaxID=1660067 RepID=A0AAX0L900_9BACT|nr:signal recognition particle protein [Campylobacter pinnipediorum]AQW84168.1 signal recognition particle protein [Campylobacter pinnipediorum subsp. pinnipediorum]OPA74537.1 signal recognition particle protein [Campylobacter pinnipediorum subsp. pinnipediorum]OPA74876.1 signal recognition particle protein [Campylobacter pinnipediorum subsp. pinnipediorum]